MTDVKTARMSERGQIIIPRGIREYINAKENTLFTIMPVDSETIIMKKLDKKKLINEFRNIRINVKEKLKQEEINQEVKKARKKK